MLRDSGPRKVRASSREELIKLLVATAEVSPELVPIVVFLINTGARKGEALALTWKSVNLERGLIHGAERRVVS